MRLRAGLLSALFILGLLGGLPVGPQASGCDTPVYRYAVYRWPAAPYEVYYFSDKKPSADEQKLHARIDGLLEDVDAPANVALLPVDLTADPDLTQTVPPDIKAAYDAIEAPTSPLYLVATPYGQTIYSGDLDDDALSALIDSPARAAMAKQLEFGKAGVLIMLTSGDKAADDIAEKTIKKVVTDVAEGKLQLYSTPPTGVAQEEPPKQDHEVGFVKVDRKDAKERFFIEQLLTIEDDLRDLDQPMVFAVFGRGRLLPPCVGRGIQYDTIVGEYVEFMTGACSCTVKDQNPGMDLLVRYDWDKAAETLAAKFGVEEGNENMLGADVFFPELTIPTTPPEQDDTAETTTTDEAFPDDDEIDSQQVAVLEPVNEDPTLPATTTEPISDDAEAAATGTAESTVEVDPATGDAAVKPAVVQTYDSIYIVGAGVAIALGALFVATFFVMRPR